MNLEDFIDYVAEAWMMVFVFITAPIWFLPYIVYRSIKSRKERRRK